MSKLICILCILFSLQSYSEICPANAQFGPIGGSLTFKDINGKDCPLPPILTDYVHLKNETLYGYILKQIAPLDCTKEDELSLAIFLNGQCQTFQFVPSTTETYLFAYDYTDTGDYIQNTNFISQISFYSKVVEGKMCVFTNTIYGSTPVICAKSKKETSIHQMSCYNQALETRSKSMFNFSGRMVECINLGLNGIFFDDFLSTTTEAHTSALNSFSSFRQSFVNYITLLLVCFIFIQGIKLALEPQEYKISDFVFTCFKVVGVLYFTGGLSTIYNVGSGIAYATNDGLRDIVIPILVSAISTFSTWVFQSGSNGICYFDIESYPSGYQYYALFDAIDCRISYYFGFKTVFDASNAVSIFNSSGNNDATLAFFRAVGMAIFGGEILIGLFFICIGIGFLFLCLHGIFIYALYIVILYLMFYLSPIFIPLVLFERTKGYFDSWLRVTIGCVVHPAIVFAFFSIVISCYDQMYWGTCKFNNTEVQGKNFMVPTIDNTSVSDTECNKSFGWQMYDLYFGKGTGKKSLIIFEANFWKAWGGFLEKVVYILIATLLFIHFSEGINQLAEDISGGVYLSQVLLSPKDLYNQAKNSLQKLGDIKNTLAKNMQRKAKPSGEVSGSKGGVEKDNVRS